MKYVYSHLPQQDDIGFEGRAYRVTEGLLDFQGRKVLYLCAEASEITFCDRSYAAHLASINVKGYVTRWKYETGKEGEPLSEIEAVTDEGEKQAISRLLRASHNVPTVNFVC
jgi:hypothetical protein